MKLNETYRLFTWVEKNVKDGDKASYTALAKRASLELGLVVSASSVKSALQAVGVEIKTVRGQSGAKFEVERLAAENEALSGFAAMLVADGAFSEGLLENISSDSDTHPAVKSLLLEFEVNG